MNLKNAAFVASLIAGLVVVSGIVYYLGEPGHSKYADVSSEPEYSWLVGTERRTTEDMKILGITMDRNYAKKIDHYSIYPQPGIGGPEVVSQAVLSKGTVIAITKVEKCVNCFILDGEKHRYSVAIINPAFANDQIPIYINESSSGAFSNTVKGKTVENK